MNSAQLEEKRMHTLGYDNVKKIIDQAQNEVKVSADLYVGFDADNEFVGCSWQNILNPVDSSMNDELCELFRYIRHSGRELTWQYNFIKGCERPSVSREYSLTDWVRKEMAQSGDNLFIYWDNRFVNDLTQFKQLATAQVYNRITIKITGKIYAEVKNEIDSLGLSYVLTIDK